MKIEDRLALEDLNSAFCYLLDNNDVPKLVGLFAANAVYLSGDKHAEGHDQLREYFVARTKNGPRTSRHIYSGLQVQLSDENRASGRSVCLSFAQSGHPPLPPEPFMVADFEDVYVRAASGRWLIAERKILPVFRR